MQIEQLNIITKYKLRFFSAFPKQVITFIRQFR